jgi:mannose-6-phosphate isomerase-like protein (cupin superfamily)
MKIIDAARIPSKVIPEPYQRSLQLILDKRDGEDVGDFSLILSTLYPYEGKTASHSHNVAELMYIISGYGYCITDGQKTAIRPGYSVYARADENHQIVNESNETMRIVCVFLPALSEEKIKELEGHRDQSNCQ